MNPGKKCGAEKETSCGCASSTVLKPKKEKPVDRYYVTGWRQTGAGEIPTAATTLTKKDKWEHFKVALTIGRGDYKVEPGLYAVGDPTAAAPVLVTANYKLSFDALRKELGGLAAWLLVLNSKGINVWCAAGKGTFGTDELVARIESSGLKEIVNHKKLVVPQLGATGVSAHKVKKLSGFTVVFGPVRAADLPAFLAAGNKAAAEMRRVEFPLAERLRQMPADLVQGIRYLLFISAAFFVLAGLYKGGYSLQMAGEVGLRAAFNLALAYVGAMALGFLLLPYLPGRSFSFKGLFLGVILFAFSFTLHITGNGVLEIVGWFLVMGAISSFTVMNLTGSSTYTSLSGVKKEMRTAVPLQAGAAAVGLLSWLLSRFISLP
ncbi:MAG: acetyl-CoA synthase subunit gamma [Candidatus Aminicenantes bacterium]|nr:acetyl-CoA synthase subunit gamma [Candidatus Aminicenantes bacterium]